MVNIKNILLVEDDPRDVELTLAALEEHHLANKVAVVHDGAATLDYLYRRGEFKTRTTGNPVVVLRERFNPRTWHCADNCILREAALSAQLAHQRPDDVRGLAISPNLVQPRLFLPSALVWHEH
jgi:CheY-like chemotaxis protein